jgi:tetratricopeptide (TPR) repeat protein
MERRELLLKGLGGISLAILPMRLDLGKRFGAEPSVSAELQNLWGEACLSHYWFEDRRACDLLEQVLARIPGNLESSFHADLYEKLFQVRESLQAAEREVIAQQAGVLADPTDAEKHFYLGFTLTRLGRHDEALAEYEAALRNPERLCAHCFRDSWNNIGWYHYRRGNYHEALKWFDRVCELNDTGEFLQDYDKARAVENKLLVYSALTMAAEAEATTREYVVSFGRVPWPERHALAKVGIDADAMYVEHCSGLL